MQPVISITVKFQHTAARRRLRGFFRWSIRIFRFNTQPRGGGCLHGVYQMFFLVVFQHTAARRRLRFAGKNAFWQKCVSTHSRAEAAANGDVIVLGGLAVSTHSRAEAAACNCGCVRRLHLRFQHTAARRRLHRTTWWNRSQH